jgi:tetratricopeptide (TPR) repeat protein
MNHLSFALTLDGLWHYHEYMNLCDWANLALDDGVLRETVLEPNRLVLWVRGASTGKFREWERISTPARVEVDVQQGLGAMTATLITAREPLRGFLGKLLGQLRRSSGNPSWRIPHGATAEQVGERQTDWLLVWPVDDAAALTEEQVRPRCPDGKEFRRLGPSLFLVRIPAAAEPAPASSPGAPAPSSPDPRQDAEATLTAARARGDQRAEAVALTDLAVVLLQSGDAQRAVALLDQALTLSRTLEDRKQEADVLGNLGVALVAAGDGSRARETLDESLAYARSVGDRFAEKSALTGFGLFWVRAGRHAQALPFFEQAAALAEQLGDRQSLADLFWYQAVVHAELGRRDEALARAQATVDLFRKLDNPKAEVYAEHLEKFRQGAPAIGPGAGISSPAGESPFGWSTTSDATAAAAPRPGTVGPGWLRMALSAARAVGKFVGSGMKTVPATVRDRRLETCAACEHFTGLRCRLCGCYTKTKAWLPYEHCPIEKWQE